MTDRDEIIDVLVRYATGIDSRDWPLFRSCFSDDARFDYGGIGQWDTPEAITDYMRAAHSGPSMHRLSNFVIDIDGDRATSRTYVDAVVMGPKGFGAVENFGWYDDKWVRTPGGWRISFRHTTLHGVRLPGLLRLIPPSIGARVAGRLGRAQNARMGATRHAKC